MVLVDVAVPVPVVEDEAIEGFSVKGGVASDGGGTKEETFVFPLVDFTEAEGGCWAGAESGLCGVSERSPGRCCCGCFKVRVARVHNMEVVAASRRAETSVTFGFSGFGSGESMLHPRSYLGVRALLYFYSASMCTTGLLTAPTGLTSASCHYLDT
jgi:hypothetical protein